MRVVVLIAALATAMFFDLRASRAYEGPWCAVQSVGSGSVTENCRMATFEQCRMEVIARRLLDTLLAEALAPAERQEREAAE